MSVYQSSEVHADRTTGARRFVDLVTRAAYGILPTQMVFHKDRIYQPGRSPEKAHRMATMRGAAIGVESVAMGSLAVGGAELAGVISPSIVTPKDALVVGAGYLATKVYSSAVRWWAGRGEQRTPKVVGT